MPILKADLAQSVVVLVDVQAKFMEAVWERERVVRRCEFLLRAAKLLGVPSLATEQNPSRMGMTAERLPELLSIGPFQKMAFSACGSADFLAALRATQRKQAIVIGVETHICVSQTAVDLLNLGYQVIVCPDGVSSRTQEMHKLGMERLRDSGVMPMHTEAVAYEWMGTADHPLFRDVLQVVKAAATGLPT